MTTPTVRHDEYEWTKMLVILHSQADFLMEDNCLYSKRLNKHEKWVNADVDAIWLRHKLEEQFPGKVTFKYKPNCTFGNFQECIRNMHKEENSERYDCFLFVFLTFHGEGERLLFSDGMKPLEAVFEEVKMQEITRGKPKIFLIQADDVSLIPDDKTVFKGDEKIEKIKIKIPQDADRLIIKSTVPQAVTVWNHEQKNYSTDEGKPSFLIQAFCNALENAKKNDDLLTLTTSINSNMAFLIENSMHKRTSDMPVSLVTSTFTKLLKLR